MLQKSKKAVIAIISALTLCTCTTTSPVNLTDESKTLNEALDAATVIDSYFISECTPPPLFDGNNAPLDEVVAVYYETLVNFLDCDAKHTGLIQQIADKKNPEKKGQ